MAGRGGQRARKKGPHSMPRPQGRPKKQPGDPKGPYVADPERVFTSRRENMLRRYREPDDPELIEATQARKIAALKAAIRREADSDPALTDEQRTKLALLLLRPSTGDAA